MMSEGEAEASVEVKGCEGRVAGELSERSGGGGARLGRRGDTRSRAAWSRHLWSVFSSRKRYLRERDTRCSERDAPGWSWTASIAQHTGSVEVHSEVDAPQSTVYSLRPSRWPCVAERSNPADEHCRLVSAHERSALKQHAARRSTAVDQREKQRQRELQRGLAGVSPASDGIGVAAAAHAPLVWSGDDSEDGAHGLCRRLCAASCAQTLGPQHDGCRATVAGIASRRVRGESERRANAPSCLSRDRTRTDEVCISAKNTERRLLRAAS